MSWRPWLEDRALRQMRGLPAEAFDMLVQTLARICDDPHDPVFSAPAPPVPGRRVADLGDFGFIEFTVDEGCGPGPRLPPGVDRLISASQRLVHDFRDHLRPGVDSLLNEALAGVWLSPAGALAPVADSGDPVERIAFACEFLLRGVLAYQGGARVTISAAIVRPESAARRPSTRFGLIDQALAPLNDTLGAADPERSPSTCMISPPWPARGLSSRYRPVRALPRRRDRQSRPDGDSGHRGGDVRPAAAASGLERAAALRRARAGVARGSRRTQGHHSGEPIRRTGPPAATIPK